MQALVQVPAALVRVPAVREQVRAVREQVPAVRELVPAAQASALGQEQVPEAGVLAQEVHRDRTVMATAPVMERDMLVRVRQTVRAMAPVLVAARAGLDQAEVGNSLWP
jgi:hypothetical protein